MDALLLTPTQAAAVLGVSRSTVYELLGAGQIDAVHIGRSRRVVAASLTRYVNRLSGTDASAAA